MNRVQYKQPDVVAEPGVMRALLGWRSRASFGWLEGALLAIYTFVIAITIPRHEPWADEAQAWLIARDNSVWQILRYRLHYEGAPGLWHVLLHVFHAVGGRYGGIGWFGAVFAIAGMVVFLRWSPFPLLVRVLLPFTFYFQYQYAVVARSYVLFPLLVFSLCVLFPKRRGALWFALLAGLLANLSLQGTVFSFCMMGLYVWERYRRPEAYGTLRPRSLLRPTALYLGMLIFAAWTAVPAPDCDIANGPALAAGTMRDLLMKFPGPMPADQRLPEAPAWAVQAAVLHPPKPTPPLLLQRPQPQLLRHPSEWAAWYVQHPRVDAQGRPLRRPFSALLLQVVVELLALATGPVSTYKLLACVFLAMLFVWLWFLRALRMSWPWVANLLVGEAVWIADHHTGMLLIALLTAVWLAASLRANSSLDERQMPQMLDRGVVLLLVLVCVLQIVWSVVSIHNEFERSYDPGPETAVFLHQHPHARVASFDFEATAVQPYFDRNPFFNLRNSYWIWTTENNPNGYFPVTIQQRPEMVLFSEDLLAPGFMHNEWAPLSRLTSKTQQLDLRYNPIVAYLRENGYHQTHRFCGDRFMRTSVSYHACDLIFEPATEAAAAGDQKSVSTSKP